MRTVLALISGLGVAVVSSSAHADWYSGDPYAAQTAWPQYTDNLSDINQILALTYDNFAWVPGAGGGVIDVVGGHFHSFDQIPGNVINTAYWEIRTGMAHNIGGALLASGSGVVTNAPTSFLQGGAAVTAVNVDIPNLALPAGNYWFGLAVGSSISPPGFFVASTTGTNGIGSPLGDNLSNYFQSANNGAVISWNYADSATVNPTVTSGLDPSYWITEVPEPTTLALVAPGALLALRRRKA